MWKEFFYFTRSQQRGIMVLISLLFLLIVVRLMLGFYSIKIEPSDAQKLFFGQVQHINDSILSSNIKDSLFFFDPNLISDVEMEMVGLSHYQRKSLAGYRDKVGRIDSMEELYKVYGFDTATVERLRDFVVISENKSGEIKPKEVKQGEVKRVYFDLNHLNIKESGWFDFSEKTLDSIQNFVSDYYITKNISKDIVENFTEQELFLWLVHNSRIRYEDKVYNVTTKDSVIVIEINSAEEEDFKKLKGIGDVFSRRIVKYRNLLGGFYSLDQLLEVYGLPIETFENIKSLLVVNKNLIRKKDLRYCTWSDLSHHPYISREQASVLMKEFDKNGDIEGDETFLKKMKMSDDDWQNIKPYIVNVK